MKKDSFILNFILGVILMILLAVAAKAQNNPPGKNTNQRNEVIKKKPITAEEAKVIYKEKYGNTYGDKRKSYSRKDIGEIVADETQGKDNITNSADSSSTAVNPTSSASNQPPKQPKAIYKGPQIKSPVIDTKPARPVSNDPKFIEHIEIEIGPGNNS